jgi:hypothetical protein
MGVRGSDGGLPDGQAVAGMLLACLALLTLSATVGGEAAPPAHRQVALAGAPAFARPPFEPAGHPVQEKVRPRIAQRRLPAGVACASYSVQLGATGAVGPYRWSVVRGRAPDGLRLDAGGRLHGIPATVATARFVVRTAAGNGRASRRPLALTTLAGDRPCLTPTLTRSD